MSDMKCHYMICRRCLLAGRAFRPRPNLAESYRPFSTNFPSLNVLSSWVVDWWKKKIVQAMISSNILKVWSDSLDNGLIVHTRYKLSYFFVAFWIDDFWVVGHSLQLLQCNYMMDDIMDEGTGFANIYVNAVCSKNLGFGIPFSMQQTGFYFWIDDLWVVWHSI